MNWAKKILEANAQFMETFTNRHGAVVLYRKAASRTSSVPERNYLTMKATRLLG
jgi:hypothetical protein